MHKCGELLHIHPGQNFRPITSEKEKMERNLSIAVLSCLAFQLWALGTTKFIFDDR